MLAPPLKLSERLKRVPASASTEMAQRARDMRESGVDVVSLSIGQPDFETPEHVKVAAFEAMKRGETGYSPIAGSADLKSAIRRKLVTENGLQYSETEILVANGAKQILFNALVATVDKGDEVLMPAPYWVSYPDIVKFTGGTPVAVATDPANDFKLDADRLAAALTPNTRWLILNSPCNPTGSAYTRAELEALANVLIRYPDVWVLSDDIYEHLLYDGQRFLNLINVAPELKSRSMIVNGVSKAYCMTGWRIGWAAAPVELIRAMTRLQSQSTSGASSISQAGATAALNGDQSHIQSNNAVYVQRRDRILHRIEQIDGLTCHRPAGAFYVYPDCSELIGRVTKSGRHLGNDDDITEALIEDARVATVQGRAFGLSPYVRLSYATSMDLIEQACDRIAEFCHGLR